MSKPESKSIVLLRSIIEAGPNGTYAEPKSLTWLVLNGLVETNQGDTNANGNIAVRATQKGLDHMSQANSPATPVTSTGAVAVQSFAIESGIAMPEVRRSSRGSKYPFDLLEAGQSFFVPATEETPNPAKSLTGTISAAQRAYAVEIPGETKVNKKGETVPATRFTRKFVARLVTENGVTGARVWRTE